MHFKSTLFLLQLTQIFCDLLGQNRLGNNLHLYKIKRFKGDYQDFFSMTLMAEMTKTNSGRKALKKFMKTVQLKKSNFRGRMRFWISSIFKIFDSLINKMVYLFEFIIIKKRISLIWRKNSCEILFKIFALKFSFG